MNNYLKKVNPIFAWNIWDINSAKAVMDAAALKKKNIILQTSSSIFKDIDKKQLREFINSYKKYVECYANRDDVKRTLLKGYHSDKTKNNTTKRSSILNERSKELEPEVQKSSKLRYKYKSLVDTA